MITFSGGKPTNQTKIGEIYKEGRNDSEVKPFGDRTHDFDLENSNCKFSSEQNNDEIDFLIFANPSKKKYFR